MDKCKICGAESKINSTRSWDICVTCPNCGEYFINMKYGSFLSSYDINKLRTYLYYHKNEKRPYLVSKDVFDEFNKDRWVDIYNLVPEVVENWYPKTFAERIDKILQYFYDSASYLGESKEYSYYDLANIYFISNISYSPEDNIEKKFIDQIEYINNYLSSEKYISMLGIVQTGPLKWERTRTLNLMPKGLSRVDEKQRNDVNNKDIFVSMAFNDGTKETRAAIKEAIISAGYSPEFIDEIIHNHQIMPEMFRLIRECKYLILEITDPNYGAYYEAGYALGLGKEVIICCNKEKYNKKYETEEDRKYERYLKPHFDIAQKQTLLWNDYDDLKKQLPEWIKYLDKQAAK